MDKKMSYHATDFLADLFGPTPSTAALVPEPDRQPDPVTAPAVDPADLGPSGFDPADWTRQPDATGRWGWEAHNRPEWQRWWAHSEDVIEPGEPCPHCGSLEKWWDLDGGEHCQRCEGDKLARGRRFAEKAARLRGAASSGKREIQRNRS